MVVSNCTQNDPDDDEVASNGHQYQDTENNAPKSDGPPILGQMGLALIDEYRRVSVVEILLNTRVQRIAPITRHRSLKTTTQKWLSHDVGDIQEQCQGAISDMRPGYVSYQQLWKHSPRPGLNWYKQSLAFQV